MNILFLCVGNSARSQIAEGLAKEMFSKKFNIESAGSKPSGFVHKGAIKTMNEIGIDISSQTSKSIQDLDDKFIKKLDFVITLCAEEVCPVFDNNAKRINWPNPDPAIGSMSRRQEEKAFREVRDNIFNILKKFYIDIKM